MGKSSKAPRDQTTTQEPWSGIQPFLTSAGRGGLTGRWANGLWEPGGGVGRLQGIYPEAARIYQSDQDVFARENPLIQSGRQQQLNYAQQLPGALAPYQQASQAALGSADITNNPALQSAMDAATRPYEQQLQMGTLPNIGRQMTAAGQYGSATGAGGSRQGIAEGVARGMTNQSILDTRGQMASQAYGQGLTARNQALALYPQTLQTGLMPSQLTGDVGRQQQGYEQMLLNEPYERYQRYASAIQPGTGIGGSITSPGMQSGGGGIGGGIAGGLGGLGTAGMMGLGGPAMWGLGALGALGGLFG